MAKIIMLGTYHCDPDGQERLDRDLLEVRPDIVICEGSEEVEAYRQRWIGIFADALSKTDLNKTTQDKWVDLENKMVYEIRTAKNYCERMGIPFFYFNDDEREQSDQPNTDRRLEVAVATCQGRRPDDVEQIVRAEAKNKYKIARLVIDADIEEFVFESNGPTYATRDCVGERDERMKDFLMGKIEVYGDATISTISGLIHILRDPQRLTLYSRIMDLNPERRLIG